MNHIIAKFCSELMKKFWVVFSLTLLLSFLAIVPTFVNNASANPPTDFQKTKLLSNLNTPMSFEFAPDGRVFIILKSGQVKTLSGSQLKDYASLSVDSGGERGLIAMTFDPNFSSNKYVYFYLNDTSKFPTILRLTDNNGVGSNQTVIWKDTNPATHEWHQGGSLAFGNDGKLYLSIGDLFNPPNAQDLSNVRGKVLRLNPDGSIPSDNPYVGQSGKRAEIWAYGLRNPFRFQIDKQTGKLYLGDVGQESWEEINLIEKGKNYGWPVCEGSCSTSGMTNPFHAYNHNGGGASVTGGPIYRGSNFPESYQGDYFYADYVLGFIKRLELDSNGVKTGETTFDPSAGTVVEMKVGPEGALYYLTISPGELFKVNYTKNQAPIANATADKTSGAAPLTVKFSSAGTSDPEGASLTYEWNFGDGTKTSEQNPTKVYNNVSNYSAFLKVSDGISTTQSSNINIVVGTPPTLTINNPQNNQTYKAGDTISYSATAKDSSGNNLPSSAFSAKVVFHHGTHFHPFIETLTGSSNQFTIINTGHQDTNVWYRLYVKVTDSQGLVTEKFVDLQPQKALFNLNSHPSGLKIVLDGIPTQTPQVIESVVGMKREVDASSPQQLNDKSYSFSNWSNGGDQKHSFIVPAQESSLTANFEEIAGFVGEYFNNKTLSGTPSLVRNDIEINFDWVFGSPSPQITADNFSARWSKTMNFEAGTYRFTSTSDDGVRVYLDNQLIIDRWDIHAATTDTKDVQLSAGNHLIKIEYFENEQHAVSKFAVNKVISSSPSPSPSPSPAFNGFKGEYFNNGSLSGTPALVRDDSAVLFDWGVNAPSPHLPADNFSARWTKTENFAAGDYNFIVTADDGVRLYIDNQLVLDKWKDQAATTYSSVKSLSSGNHIIKMEYYENGGYAVAKLNYQKMAQAQNGLKGEYYENTNFTDFNFTRIDPTINFQWGTSQPIPTQDTFSVRWTGFVMPEHTQTYTFYLNSDDGSRLYINNKLVIDNWGSHSVRERSGTVKLTSSVKVPIKVEYNDTGGRSTAELRWSSASQTKQIVHQSRLFAN